MKKNCAIKFFALFTLACLLTVSAVNVTAGTAIADPKVDTVVRLGIFKGDANGNLRLEDKIIRSEIITTFVRTLGLEEDTGTKAASLSFTDINSSHWAYNYIKTAVKYGFIAGYPDNTIGADKNITYAEALTLLTRILGYEEVLTSGKWPENVVTLCTQLGITRDTKLSLDQPITRQDVAVLIYHALSADLKK